MAYCDTIIRTLTVIFPPNAPSGSYLVNAYLGDYPDVIYDKDYFGVSKIGDDGGNGTLDIKVWHIGEMAEGIVQVAQILAQRHSFFWC